MTSGGAGAPWRWQASRRTAAHRFGGQHLALERQGVAVRHGHAQDRGGCRHARLGRGLGAPDALDLGRRLRAPPDGDRGVVGHHRQAVAAQPVGDRHRHVGVRHDLREAHGLGGPRRQLELELVAPDAAPEQVVQPEVREVVQDRVGRDGLDA